MIDILSSIPTRCRLRVASPFPATNKSIVVNPSASQPAKMDLAVNIKAKLFQVDGLSFSLVGLDKTALDRGPREHVVESKEREGFSER